MKCTELLSQCSVFVLFLYIATVTLILPQLMQNEHELYKPAHDVQKVEDSTDCSNITRVCWHVMSAIVESFRH